MILAVYVIKEEAEVGVLAYRCDDRHLGFSGGIIKKPKSPGHAGQFVEIERGRDHPLHFSRLVLEHPYRQQPEGLTLVRIRIDVGQDEKARPFIFDSEKTFS